MSPRVVLLMLTSLVATGSGFLREVVVAYYYGTSAASDAFALMLLYVEGMSVVVVLGLAGYMLVPVVTLLDVESGRAASERLMETLMLWSSVAFAPIVLLALVAPDRIVSAIAPGFSEAQAEILRAMMPWAAFGTLATMVGGLLGGVLQARAAYSAPALGRAAFSLGIMVALLAGTHRLGVRAAALGMLAGGIAQLGIQAAALWRLGWRPHAPRWSHPQLSRAMAIGFPTVTALCLTNLVMGAVQRVIASGLPEGSFAAVNYAQRTLGVLSFLGISIGTVSLTELSSAFHQQGNGAYARKLLRSHLDVVSFVMVPVSLWLALTATPVVGLLFHRGSYDARSMSITVTCLRWFAMSLVPGSLLMIFHRACPALGRPWQMTLGSAAWVASTIVGTALLLAPLQVVALPAGYLCGTLIGLFVFVWMFRGSVDDMLVREFSTYLAASALRSTLAALPLVPLSGWLLQAEGSAMALALRIVVSAGAYSLGYLLIGLATGDPHAGHIRGAARRWLAAGPTQGPRVGDRPAGH